MHFHLRIHRWVLWWVYIGIVCGIVAVVNILSRNLTQRQEEIIITIGIVHWVLGGVACYCFDSIRIEKPSETLRKAPEPRVEPQREWFAASEFMLPGGRKSLLPPRY